MRQPSTLLRRMLALAAQLAALYAILCALAWLAQRRLVYFPVAEVGATPAAIDLEYEELALEADDGTRLAAWWIPHADARGVVLVCHGNAGNVSNRLHLAQAFHELGHAVLLFDYRGFGASEGRPDEEGTYRDAEAAYAACLARGFAARRVVAYGESLGGAVAIELARRRPVGAVFVESTFTSLPDVGARAMPFLPVRLLLRYRYDSLAKVPQLDAPLLVAHGRDDEVVPFAHAERLVAAAPPGARLLETGGGHDGGGFTRRTSDREAVRAFLDAALGG